MYPYALETAIVDGLKGGRRLQRRTLDHIFKIIILWWKTGALANTSLRFCLWSSETISWRLQMII